MKKVKLHKYQDMVMKMYLNIYQNLLDQLKMKVFMLYGHVIHVMETQLRLLLDLKQDHLIVF